MPALRRRRPQPGGLPRCGGPAVRSDRRSRGPVLPARVSATVLLHGPERGLTLGQGPPCFICPPGTPRLDSPANEPDHRREDRRGFRLQIAPGDRPGGPRPRGRGQGGEVLRASAPGCPGFRPGKAPEAVVRKRFNDAIRQTVLEEVLRESWETAKSSESLKPIADPSVRNLKFEEGSPIEFDLLVEVRPEIKLDRIGGFKVERRCRRGARQRGRRAARLAPGGQGGLDPGHRREAVARARWCGSRWRRSRTAPRAPRSPTTWCWARTRRSRSWRSGSWRSSPARPRETEVRFPDDHPDESRRGQSRRVRVTLHEVKRQELPPARRRLRPGDGRLREPRRPPRRGPPRPRARRRARRRCPGAAGAPRPGGRGQRHPGARVPGAPADARLRRDLPDPAGAAPDLRAAVPRDRRDRR